MARTFSVTMQNATIVGDATLIIIHTASGATTVGSEILILRAWVGNQATETSDQLGIMLAQKASAFGTYTSATPVPHSLGGSASGITGGTAGAAGTAGTDASAEGAGTVTSLIYDGFNNLNGWLWVPTPEERIMIHNDLAIILKIVGTPATLTNWSAGITYEELN
jgi:hypothetical protein